MSPAAEASELVRTPLVQRRRWRVHGRVQGVGFRPFIFRLARVHRLTGWVCNDSEGVLIEAQGEADELARFLADIRAKPPPLAVIDEILGGDLIVACDSESPFAILPSRSGSAARADVTPDLACCDTCLRELRDPNDRRRHGYPLINCTDCGPRFSIIHAVPYDRPNTTMAAFVMCEPCRGEYLDPRDRRFHAQPTACRDCGPTLHLLPMDQAPAASARPIPDAADRLLQGQTVAIKGLGGYHLAVMADDERAVRRLRERKHRPVKPLAVMVPSVEAARRLVHLSDRAAKLLQSPIAPIVLARRRRDAPVAASVAPQNHRLGVMLANTPLHHLLFDALNGRCSALVMTSANDTDEPLVFSDDEAEQRLGASCDAILSHDRPIERPVDDSVVLDAAPRAPIILRRSRGLVPTPIALRQMCRLPGICLGGDLKSVVGVVRAGGEVILSQHLGDLAHSRTYANFKQAAESLLKLFNVRPAWVAHDLHPAYASTMYARQLARALHVPRVQVQHHHAHAAALLAEHGHLGPALAIICDGTGYGPDGTVWGGELLAVDGDGFRRLAHLRPLQLAGGDSAAKQTWRSALSLLYAAFGEQFARHPAAARLAPQAEQFRFVVRMLRTGVNCVMSSSAGRVFDGVAALLALCDENRFEAQAPMALECAAARAWPRRRTNPEPLFTMPGGPRFTIDLSPLIRRVVAADARGTAAADELAALFHEQFVAAWEAAVVRAAEETGLVCVALSGGVFCNEIVDRELTERLVARGFHVLRHERVPPNDGGLALGQAAVAARRIGAAAPAEVS